MRQLLALVLAIITAINNYVTYGCYPYQAETAPAYGPGLYVHFIDVGQADSILLECEGEFLLIDGGNRADGQLVVSYLEQQGVRELEAVVCTHAHEDHAGGLSAVLAVYPTKAVYAPTKTYASWIFDDFVKYADQQDLDITIPSPGDTLHVGSTLLTVLGPVKSYAETNNSSIVLKAVYEDTAFLFTGDMEKAAETDMLDHWEDRMDWHADVLKMGHHGSDTSSGYRFLNEVMPTYGIIPVGTGNDYGHPHKEPLERMDQAKIIALRTDRLGHIVARSDGSQVEFTWQNQNAQPEKLTPGDRVFIGNRNSKTLHTGFCGSLPAKKNRVEFTSYDEALAQGFLPCAGCLG